MDNKTKQVYMKSFARVGAIVGLALGDFLLGDEYENVEPETPVNKGAKHKDQSDLGEQHAAGHESDESDIDALFAIGVQFINALGQYSIDTTRILAGMPINRPSESTLGIEGETGSEEKTDQLNESASS